LWYFFNSLFAGDNSALLKLKSLDPTGKVTSNTKLSISVESTSTYSDPSMKAIVTINVKKHVRWFPDIPIPNFVYGVIAPAITKVIKGVKHISGK